MKEKDHPRDAYEKHELEVLLGELDPVAPSPEKDAALIRALRAERTIPHTAHERETGRKPFWRRAVVAAGILGAAVTVFLIIAGGEKFGPDSESSLLTVGDQERTADQSGVDQTLPADLVHNPGPDYQSYHLTDGIVLTLSPDTTGRIERRRSSDGHFFELLSGTVEAEVAGAELIIGVDGLEASCREGRFEIIRRSGNLSFSEEGRMSYKKWIMAGGVAATAVVVAVTSGLVDLHTGTDEVTLGAKETAVVSGGGEVAISSEETHSDRGSASEEQGGREVIQVSGLRIAGSVTDKTTGAPIRSFDIYLRGRLDGDSKRTDLCRETVHSPDGTFSIPIPAGGKYSLTVATSHHRPEHLSGLEVAEGKSLTGLAVKLDPGLSLSGRVVADATGHPVEGAFVGITQYGHSRINMECLLSGRDESIVHARTDDGGRFTLSGLTRFWDVVSRNPIAESRKCWTLAAVHDDFAEGTVTAREGEAAIEIRLKPGFYIHGRVFDRKGSPEPGVVISLGGGRMSLKGLLAIYDPGKTKAPSETWEEARWNGTTDPYGTVATRPVLTAADGSFRIGPVASGFVEVTATPPPMKATRSVRAARGFSEATETANAGIGKADSAEFARESKLVQIVAGDVEVNFGMAKELVRWQGVFRYLGGTPIGGAELRCELIEVLGDSGHRLRSSTAETDRDGRFTFEKLVPGSYKLRFSHAGKFGSIECGEITFQAPGRFERDIMLSGAMVHGLVVDESTGLPIKRKGILVTAVNRDTYSQISSSVTDGEGRFTVLELPPGIYNFQANDLKLARGIKKNVKVERGAVIDDLRIAIPPSGNVVFRCYGFDESQVISLFFWDPETPNLTWGSGADYNRETGMFEEAWPLRVGDWRVEIHVRELGQVVREFTVYVGATTEVVVNRSDFDPFSGDIVLDGSLKNADGTAVEKTVLRFRAQGIPGVTGDLTCPTGDEGAFRLSGFKPGLWEIEALRSPGNTLNAIELESIVIPTDASNPYPCRLVVPRARVRALLCNAATGERLHDRTHGRVCLLDPERDVGVAQPIEFEYNPLYVPWLPAGRYRLRIAARGYQEFESQAVSLVDNELLDLGRIDLEPMGMVFLECVDTSGNRAPCTPEFPGLPGRYYFPIEDGDITPKGKNLYRNLPFGELAVRFKAQGFRTRNLTIEIKRGECAEHRIVLERE